MEKPVKKIKLSELKVQSFITTDKLKSVFGGQPMQPGGAPPNPPSYVDPTSDSGSSVTLDIACPTMSC